MARILALNGPNLDRLGTREPDIYGAATLPGIMTGLEQAATGLGHTLSAFQTNAEPELIEMIRQAEREEIDFILINPAAWTHTSIALRDALAASGIPFIELHISNVFAREPFRHKSFFSDLAIGVITGFGPQSYELALSAADRWLNDRRP